MEWSEIANADMFKNDPMEDFETLHKWSLHLDSTHVIKVHKRRLKSWALMMSAWSSLTVAIAHKCLDYDSCRLKLCGMFGNWFHVKLDCEILTSTSHGFTLNEVQLNYGLKLFARVWIATFLGRLKPVAMKNKLTVCMPYNLKSYTYR